MQSVLHLIIGPKKERHDLSGRTAIVTGGANGIGFEISRQFAQAKAKVIMINKKEDQGRDAIEQIRQETPGADVDWVCCDLGNLNEVKTTFNDLREKLDRLDLMALIDILVLTFWVNSMQSIFYIRLFAKPRRYSDTPPPRIVFEASEVHRIAPSTIHFGSLEEINDREFGPTHLYARSKLAMILCAKFLLPEKGFKKNGDHVYALSVHPGTVNTNMQQQWRDAYPGLFGKMLSWAMTTIGRVKTPVTCIPSHSTIVMRRVGPKNSLLVIGPLSQTPVLLGNHDSLPADDALIHPH